MRFYDSGVDGIYRVVDFWFRAMGFFHSAREFRFLAYFLFTGRRVAIFIADGLLGRILIYVLLFVGFFHSGVLQCKRVQRSEAVVGAMRLRLVASITDVYRHLEGVKGGLVRFDPNLGPLLFKVGRALEIVGVAIHTRAGRAIVHLDVFYFRRVTIVAAGRLCVVLAYRFCRGNVDTLLR